MKLTITETKEVNVEYLQAYCGVRYWEDGKVNGEEDTEGKIPCREGDIWKPLIKLKTGKIINWTQGTKASVHYKVCDAGEYALLDADKNEVKRIDGYVPVIMCPGDSGYGDYVIMDINEDGQIQKFVSDLAVFETQDD